MKPQRISLLMSKLVHSCIITRSCSFRCRGIRRAWMSLYIFICLRTGRLICCLLLFTLSFGEFPPSGIQVLRGIFFWNLMCSKCLYFVIDMVKNLMVWSFVLLCLWMVSSIISVYPQSQLTIITTSSTPYVRV